MPRFLIINSVKRAGWGGLLLLVEASLALVAASIAFHLLPFRHAIRLGSGALRRPAAERRSIAFFLDPNPDARVEAISSCVPAGEAPRHAPITAHDYLQQRFAATYGR